MDSKTNQNQVHNNTVAIETETPVVETANREIEKLQQLQASNQNQYAHNGSDVYDGGDDEGGDLEDDDFEETNAKFYMKEDDEDDEDDHDDEGIMMRGKAEVVAHAIVEGGMPSPPDGGWGWVIVACAFFTFVVLDGCTSSFGLLLPNIVDEFKKGDPSIGRSQVAWAGSLLGGFSLCIGPIVSALTNKFGCRIITIAGAIISGLGFVGASFSPNLPILLLTYGVVGGLGAGLLYLPAIVCVGYYFESKRAVATGIALSGSGIGAILFAPVITALSDVTTWRDVCLGFGGMAVLLTITGSLMRPLEISVEPLDGSESKTPLLQRIAEDKKKNMEKTTFVGSDYFMVQLPDGTMEKRPKTTAINIDPGVHSVLYLDQLAQSLEAQPPTLPTISSHVDILPPISESNNAGATSPTEKVEPAKQQQQQQQQATSVPNGPGDIRPRSLHKHMSHAEYLQTAPLGREGTPTNKPLDGTGGVGTLRPPRARTTSQGQEISPHHGRDRRHSEGGHSPTKTGASPPVGAGMLSGKTARPTKKMTREGNSFTSKGSEALFCYESLMSSRETGLADGEQRKQPAQRKYSIRAVPSSGSFHRKSSFADSGNYKSSVSNMRDSHRDIFDDDYRFLLSTRNDSLATPLIRRMSIDRKASVDNSDSSKFIIRPLSRKDIFYSGSIQNLPEYQSQDLSGYHQSIINIAKKDFDEDLEMGAKKPSYICCPGLAHKTGAFKTALAQMMDFSLIKNPIFLTIAFSAVFGMLGFFVPIVYVIDYSVKQGIDKESAAYLISVIGITSTVGRVVFGLISDRPGVNSLLLYNLCVLIMGISTFVLPFCFNYYLIAFMYTCFGTALSGFIALSSIILVELLGLENLTNAFGLLIFFRGISSVLGTPLSGAIFDATQSYDIPFHLAGVFLIVASLITFMIPCISRFAPPKPLLQPRKHSLGPLEDILEENGETSGSEDHDHSITPSPAKANGKTPITANGAATTHA